MKLKFHCSQCSLCCRVPEALEAIGLEVVEGHCVNLQDDNSCGIYETRPDECRIDKLYTLGTHSSGLPFNYVFSEAEYLRLCAKSCNQLMDQAMAPEELRLDPEIYDKSS